MPVLPSLGRGHSQQAVSVNPLASSLSLEAQQVRFSSVSGITLGRALACVNSLSLPVSDPEVLPGIGVSYTLSIGFCGHSMCNHSAIHAFPGPVSSIGK